ncbi:MAG: class I SAM-dependent methyltransferase, partial [Pseudomonadales bacterium]
MSNLRLSVPREFRRGGKADNEVESVDSGYDLIQLMCRNLGKATLAETDVLDMGCGTKLVQAILDRELPVRSYVGIDVHTPLIEFLKCNVTDDRFTFFPSDTHNEMYNPEGKPLSA